jgi:excisionase family DNA binding protein
MPDAPYMTAADVARELRCSTKTVYRIASADPTMPVLRLGGKLVRFPRERLERWLANREQGRGRPRLVSKAAGAEDR